MIDNQLLPRRRVPQENAADSAFGDDSPEIHDASLCTALGRQGTASHERGAVDV